jgi:hypothetical protein
MVLGRRSSLGSMGKFDKEIAWLRERKAIAVEDLNDFKCGRRRQWSGPDGTVEITQHLIDRAERDIDLFDRLIAAYERHTA